MPTLIAALVVFAAFAIEAKIKHTAPLTTAQAFTSLSILALLTAPAMMLLMSLPQVAAATGCIKRIQKFLLAKGFDDQRTFTGGSPSQYISEKKIVDFSIRESRISTESSESVLSVSDLVVGPTTESKFTTNSLSLAAKKGTVTMIIGPVGSGKSTLLKAILGEISPKSGTVGINTPLIAYCSQTPWLQNASIRDNIIGPTEIDPEWYRTIVRVCALEEDFAQMPEQDLSIIGSRGITLSGGQKHRVVSLYPESCVYLECLVKI
jgi:ATP-binding cassette subfamily C (CFTR/MRP) protein 1